MTDHTTLTFDDQPARAWTPRTESTPALVVIWSCDEQHRIGEVLLPYSNASRSGQVFGRGDAPRSDGSERLSLIRQRPGLLEPTPPLRSPGISREQLYLRADGTELRVENIGRCPMHHNGRPISVAQLYPGDVLELRGQLLLLCVRRPSRMPPLPGTRSLPAPAFGAADRNGLVGESPALWEVRRQIAQMGPRQTHVLILGPSGTGKELVAQAIHQSSPRHNKPLISRNASTFPETLVDAELFGNTRNYPNPGMAERPGLIGQADGGTLFLDEIGELPTSLQSHLLRVLDQGEYQRLGDAAVRHADLRLIGATNRPTADLKHDLRPRFQNQITLPGLNDRPEDIPLLARHLLRRITAKDASIADRFRLKNPQDEPWFDLELIRALVQHVYSTHVRELESLLWWVVDHSPGPYLEYHDDLPLETTPRPSAGTHWPAVPTAAPDDAGPMRIDGRLESGSVTEPPLVRQGPGSRTGSTGVRWEVDPSSIPREVIQECLERHQGAQKHVWRELGLRNRFVLQRLLKKHGLSESVRSEGPVESDG